MVPDANLTMNRGLFPSTPVMTLSTVTTEDFVKQLEAVNWSWSLKQANIWIEYYVTTFKDISSDEGEARTFMLFNPNGGL